MEAFLPIIFGVIGVGVGGLIFAHTFVSLHRQDRSATWAQVKGKVLTSDVVEIGDPGDPDYSAKVTYEYEVDGIRYTSDRIEFGGAWATWWAAKGTAGRYPAQSLVTVYYDPHKPSFSVLEREVKLSPMLYSLFIALGFFVFGMFFLFRD